MPDIQYLRTVIDLLISSHKKPSDFHCRCLNVSVYKENKNSARHFSFLHMTLKIAAHIRTFMHTLQNVNNDISIMCTNVCRNLQQSYAEKEKAHAEFLFYLFYILHFTQCLSHID